LAYTATGGYGTATGGSEGSLILRGSGALRSPGGVDCGCVYAEQVATVIPDMWQSLRLHARQKCRRVRWRRVGVCLLLLCSVRWLRSGGAGQPTSFTQPQASSPPPPSPAPRAICQVPHVLHQTWKSREVQSLFVPRITSWFKVNPGWEYRFWTDADNRALIRDHFPESLAMFDGYHSAIQRADAIRYFILYKYGGVYADLDFEALQPLGDLLARPEHQDTGVLLGQEPLAHARVLYDQPRMLCNAIMISCAGHPFWAAVIAELHKRYDAGIKTVRATGPRMLNDVVEAWLNVSSESTHTAMPKVAVRTPPVASAMATTRP
jgi:hypothetical protein